MSAACPITIILPDLGGGGAQRVMLTIAGGLDKARFSPRILVLGGSQSFAAEVPAGVAVEIGSAQRLRDGLPWLVRRLRNEPPTVAISVMGYLNLALLATRPLLPRDLRLVVREANTIAATSRALPGWLPAQTLYGRLYPRAAAIICPTRIIAAELAAWAPATAPRANVIANPVDVDRLRERAMPPKRVPGSGLRLVAVARLTQQKGLDRLVELLPNLPDGAHVSVFGAGPEHARLESRIGALDQQARITLHGFSPDVPAWMAGADALLLPSRWEGLPNVVLECLAVGTPVIASREAEVSEVARDAARGALKMAAVETEFAPAISLLHIQRDLSATPRPSLLPAAYHKHIVIQRWQDLLTQIAASAAH